MKYFESIVNAEMEFISAHTEECDAVVQGGIKVDETIGVLVEGVYERADAYADIVLRYLEREVSGGLKKTGRVDWVNTSRANTWRSYGRVSNPNGKKVQKGTIYIRLGCYDMPHRLLGYIHPRGGMQARRAIVAAAKKKGMYAVVASDHPEKYTDLWDAVVWFDHKVSAKMDAVEIAAKQASRIIALMNEIV